MRVADGRGRSDGLLESGFGSVRAADLLSWSTRLHTMLDIEVALARTQADLGLIPRAAADAIAAAVASGDVDMDALHDEAASAATPVIPMVRRLGAAAGETGAAHLHHGATSQDIIDTAMMLQVGAVLSVLEAELLGLADACAALADGHRGTVAAGRTLGQQAVPITIGLRAARWMGAIDRRVEALRAVRPRILQLQLGGAAGTLSVYGDRGRELVIALASALELGVPDLPWHAERDRVVELAGVLAGVVASVSTIAGDIVLGSQTEVGELREAAGEGPGSSAMPHKRNPVHAIAARAAARLATGELTVLLAVGEHEQERAAGAWQAEWVALPSALIRTVGAVEAIRGSVASLEVHPDRAQANLALGWGLSASEQLATALSGRVGRPEAQRLTGELARTAALQGRQLVEVLREAPEIRALLGEQDPAEVLAPSVVLGEVDAMIDRALATHRALTHAPKSDRQP